ncbi:MAG: hypothetical protein WC878_04785 [Candidatus Paceibacterota bacterium]|jgi:hypothetical protein
MEKDSILIGGVSGENEEKEVIKSKVRSRVKEMLDGLRDTSAKPIEGEIEKTRKQLEYIEFAEATLEKTFKKLSIPHEGRFVEPEQIHFLAKEIFEKKFPGVVCDAGGLFRTSEQAIYMNNEAVSSGSNPDDREMFNLEDLTHECIHLSSRLKYHASVDAQKQVSVGSYRTGYLVISPENGERKFNGFNEGVVCITQRMLLQGEAAELEKRFGITQEQLADIGYGIYVPNQKLVYALVEKIAKHRREKPGFSLTRIIRGQFTGEMMHLRDIEQIYGKKSLEILAKFQSSQDPKNSQERDKLILEYFQSDDPQERSDLKDIILNEKKAEMS